MSDTPGITEVTEFHPDGCYQCGKMESHYRPIRDCRKCEHPVCIDCAEVDYGGGYDGRGISQWDCDRCLNPAAYIAQDEPDYLAATLLSELADEAPTAYATAVLSGAARHLARIGMKEGVATS